MSQDESIVLVLSAAVMGWFGFAWYQRLFTTNVVAAPPHWFKWLSLTPPAALIGIFIVLKTMAAHDVRDAVQYLILYSLLGGAWMLTGTRLLASWGVSFRDDAVERRNAAAAIVVASALVAHAAIYSGANVGDGPGWWVVVIAAALGVIGWLALWWIVEKFCTAAEQITVERDASAAIRFGGYMIGSGLIWARAVAGDWVSLPNTVRDMWVAWPAVVLTAVVIAVERSRAGQKTSVNTSARFRGALRCGRYRRDRALAALVAQSGLRPAMSDAALTATPDIALVPLPTDDAFRRAVIFQCCKWDPQVGDVSTISDHACVLSAETAAHLERTSETLAAETLEIEKALLQRPDLWRELGIGARLRGALAETREADAVRVMRFDFHPTPEGWALSEVNSDVPGGFAEASALPRLAEAHVPGAVASGDAASALVAAITERLTPAARIAFVHATAYSDDRQVMQFLANRVSDAGFEGVLVAPDHVRWSDGRAKCVASGLEGPIDAIVRFFPADWLVELPKRSGWRDHFSAQTLMANPPRVVLTQSKRLPLVWDRIGVAAPTWRTALPETRDPRDAPWREDSSWLLKPSFGRVGEDIVWRGGGEAKTWRRVAVSATLWPRGWIAQRRFTSRALQSRSGPRHLCIGVFTIDGRAAGFYGRLSANNIIEKHAQDAPILVEAPKVKSKPCCLVANNSSPFGRPPPRRGRRGRSPCCLRRLRSTPTSMRSRRCLSSKRSATCATRRLSSTCLA